MTLRTCLATASAAGLLLTSSLAWSDARVQIVHAAPFADSIEGTSVTVSANGNAVLEGFTFAEFTEYLELPAGDYDLAVTPTGADSAAIEASVTLESGVSYTVLAVGDGINQDLALWPLVDDADAPADGNLNIRVVHAAPFAGDIEDTEVSIRTAGGAVVNDLVGVPYFAQSGFFEIPAGNYDLKVASNDGGTNFIDPLAVDLPAGLDITVIAIGDGVNQPLGILALPVGTLETRAPVDNSMLGIWTAPETAGDEGFFTQPIPAENRLVASVYTYALDGSGDQAWFVFDTCSNEPGTEGCATPGAFDGETATGTLYTATGGVIAGDVPSTTVAVGTAEINFESCSQAVIDVELNDGATVSWNVERLTQTVVCTAGN